MKIGPYRLRGRVLLAPMAGVTDRPFRVLCRRQGAALAVSEMVSADARLRETRKSRLRIDHEGEPEPRSVQIAGADPAMLAEAARYNVDRGAQIVDINMGCPAKKVCRRAAGSALLRDEALVARILDAVVGAVDVPVTLKIRTGWDPANRNGVRVARIAESAGIAALAVHGRTRACRFAGVAEYETMARIKAEVGIPVIANGDITEPEKARDVLRMTGADAVMIGRAAQGKPWLFASIDRMLDGGEALPPPDVDGQVALLSEHLRALYDFYGEQAGVRVARKHVGWYLNNIEGGREVRTRINELQCAQRQLEMVVSTVREMSSARRAGAGVMEAAA